MRLCRTAVRVMAMGRAGVHSPDPSAAAAAPFPPLSPWLPAPGESRSLLDLLELTSETTQIIANLSAIFNLFLRSRIKSSDDSENSVVIALMSSFQNYLGFSQTRIPPRSAAIFV